MKITSVVNSLKKHLVKQKISILAKLLNHNVPFGTFQKSLEIMMHNGFQCSTMLDVGANRGLWSEMAHKIIEPDNVVLIEPQKEMEQYLKKLSDKYNNWTYNIIALGSNNTNGIMTIWDDTYGTSLLPKKDSKLLATGKQRRTNITTIDNLITNNLFTIPSLVKIDVQGYELEVLKGSQQLFGTTEVFVIETSLFSFSDVPGQPEIFDVIKFMHHKGYVIYDFASFLRRPHDNALGQCDIIFVKKDSKLRSSNKW